MGAFVTSISSVSLSFQFSYKSREQNLHVEPTFFVFRQYLSGKNNYYIPSDWFESSLLKRRQHSSGKSPPISSFYVLSEKWGRRFWHRGPVGPLFHLQHVVRLRLLWWLSLSEKLFHYLLMCRIMTTHVLYKGNKPNMEVSHSLHLLILCLSLFSLPLFHPTSLPLSCISHTSVCWCVDYPWRLNTAKGLRHTEKIGEQERRKRRIWWRVELLFQGSTQ